MRLSRRDFLTALAVLPAAHAHAAPADGLYLPPADNSDRGDLFLPGTAPPGIAASPAFMNQIDMMRAITEGSGDRRLRIIFEFTCPRSPDLYRRIRPMLERASFSWIPIPSEHETEDAPAAALFAQNASASTLADVFAGKPAKATDAAAARRQGTLFRRRIGPALYNETARPFATPTLFYRDRDNETRIIRGAPDLGTLRTIVASAAG